MNESKELKPGGTKKMQVGDQYLILKPIPYGRLKQIMKIVFNAMDKFTKLSNKDIFLKFPEVFEENLPKLVPLMFTEQEHPFLNSAWVDENLSIWHMRTIVEDMIVINGLQDFLGKMGEAKRRESPPAPAQDKRQMELSPA